MTSANLDDAFREAVAAIDAGNVGRLEQMIAANPALVRERLETPGAWLRDKVGNAVDGFFKRPYLLWFVAEDPVRNGRLPANIATVADLIIEAARRESPANLQEQLDYALSLVSWSWIARLCNVQIALIDVLVDAGADLDGNPNNALVNGNVEAAAHMLDRGAPPNLAAALALGRWEEAERLLPTANRPKRQFALVLAALNGQTEGLRRMIDAGVDVNEPSDVLYSHGRPLHHAVCSGSLDAVKMLVEAGADTQIKDTAWNHTPLGWAKYYVDEIKSGREPKQYAEIADYLSARDAHE